MGPVLVTDMRHSDAGVERSILAEAGIDLVTGYCTTESEVIAAGEGAMAFLVSLAPITRRVLSALPDLKLVVKYGVGVDNIDVAAATELGKLVANVPDYATEEVAVHAASLTLAGVRMTHVFADAMRKGDWIDDPGRYRIPRLSGLSLGLIGFGRIARKYLGFMKPMIADYLFYDPVFPDSADGGTAARRVGSVGELFERCDIVSVHAPLSEATRGLVDREALGRGKNRILINTARGELVDRDAVVDALDNGALRFFGTDVWWGEPPDFSQVTNARLLAHERVLATPHMGWCSDSSEVQVRRDAAAEVVRFVRGEQLSHLVNGAAHETR